MTDPSKELIERARDAAMEIITEVIAKQFTNTHDSVVSLVAERLAAFAKAESLDLQPLKDACDRDWKDETPQQIIVIAANAIHWRNRQVEITAQPAKPQTPVELGLNQIEAATALSAHPSEQLVIDLARELYDAFIMGGCGPSDTYPLIRRMLMESLSAQSRQAPEYHRYVTNGASRDPCCAVCGEEMSDVVHKKPCSRCGYRAGEHVGRGQESE